MSAYLADWAEGGLDHMIRDFGIERELVEGFEVLVAYYLYEDYSGDAFVLFRDPKDGALWEVNGSHCSCYGLSEQDYAGDTSSQWEPELTTREAILHRMEHGRFTYGDRNDEIVTALRAALEA